MRGARSIGIRRSAWGLALATALALLGLAGARMTAASARPTAVAASTPTLGVAGAVGGTTRGFGERRPPEINFGGDPTSFVTHVHWQSWGGAQAVGHGTADWVWPGWCVACASNDLRATVVAFDRTSCDGQSAYAHVEWFFPSRGMTFTPSLTGENLCTGKYPTEHFHEYKCRPLTLESGGRAAGTASEIETSGPPLHCGPVRTFLASLDLARYFGHSTKFVRDGWYCGSQYVHSDPGPQGGECERGDYESVGFLFTRAR